jgi:hypothetical protein
MIAASQEIPKCGNVIEEAYDLELAWADYTTTVSGHFVHEPDSAVVVY